MKSLTLLNAGHPRHDRMQPLMKRKRKPLPALLWLGAGLVILASVRAGETDFQPPDTQFFLQGRFIFNKNCATCHGKWGDGKGDMSAGMLPRPRSFISGMFKYHSTPAGFLPTNEDLMRTVRQGIPGTAMPSFATLSEKDIHAVTEYLKSFSSKWRKKENYSAPLRLPPLPAWFDHRETLLEHSTKGRELFNGVCAACHGPKGDGQGPLSGQLKDQWDQACPPSDLRQNALRSGRQLTDIYRVLLTGISATPMPSFADSLNDEQRWDLIAFIAQLRREHHPD
jgi:mono/diheme cytochrome c family protein